VLLGRDESEEQEVWRQVLAEKEADVHAGRHKLLILYSGGILTRDLTKGY